MKHHTLCGTSFEFYDDSTFKFYTQDCSRGYTMTGSYKRDGNYITLLNDYYGLKEMENITFDSIYKSNYFIYQIFLIESKWKVGWGNIKIIEIDRNYGKNKKFDYKIYDDKLEKD